MTGEETPRTERRRDESNGTPTGSPCESTKTGDDRADDGRRPGDSTDGATDPRLDPTSSPGFGSDVTDLSEIEVDRDVTIGSADPEELTATDTAPVADADLEELRSLLTAGTPVDRRRAAVAVSKRPPADRAVEPLATAALEDPDSKVRQFAVEALATHGDESVVSVVRRVAADEDPWVRAEAVVAVDGIDRVGNEEFLESKLDDDHHAVRRNAMIALHKIRGSDAVPMLLEATSDPSERVREWAVELLGDIDDERARTAVSRAAENDESGFVRDTARNSLGSPDGTGGPDAQTGAGGSNPRHTPGRPGGRDDADGLNDPPDL